MMCEKSAVDFRGVDLCVGIDPHVSLLEKWGLADDAVGLRAFTDTIIEATHKAQTETKAKLSLKPQLAFFERRGSSGVAVVEDLARARRNGNITLPVIMDAKRGDIGSTMAGYADAFLEVGAPFAGDALTVSPYLGAESTRATCETAARNGKTVFLLCLTSNPEARALQQSVAKQVFNFALSFNREFMASGGGYPPVGLVVGATTGSAATEAGIQLGEFNGPFLSPGVGAQGAGKVELRDVFGDALPNVVPSVSRSVLNAGPSVEALAAQILATVDELELPLS